MNDRGLGFRVELQSFSRVPAVQGSLLAMPSIWVISERFLSLSKFAKPQA